MGTWLNDDGLFIKFGTESAADVRGGAISSAERGLIEFDVDYTDVLSATAAILGRAAGSYGVRIPEGARIEAVETVVTAPFTSSGTVGSATLVMGLVKTSDETTLDADAFTTTSFVGSVLDAAGERTYIVPGVTGAGSAIGTTLAENGLVVVSNSQHALHPYTAGSVRVRVFYTRLA